MVVSPLQAAFTGINQVRGPVVPVTVFMEVSAYPSAEAAMAALKRAKQELAEAKDRLQVLKIEQARIMRTGDAPSIEYEAYSFEDECDYASHHVRHCHEEVWRVEKAMGLFHPKHRALLAGWVESAIGLLDSVEHLDGGPDAEEEPLEDAFVKHDPDFAMMDSDGRDVSWPEWHTRGRHKLAGGLAEMTSSMIHEDAEDDDPDSGVEDGQFDGEEDRCEAGDDGCGPLLVHGHVVYGSDDDAEAAFPDYGIDQTKPGSPPNLFAEHAMMRPHLHRARRRRKIVD